MPPTQPAAQRLGEATQYPSGLVLDVAFEAFSVTLTSLPGGRLRFHIADGPYARTEEVAISAVAIRPGVFLVSWVETSGATVVHIQDFVEGTLHSHATLPGGKFLRMTAPMQVQSHATRSPRMTNDIEQNKALVLEAMTSLFQRRDASAVDRLYAEGYVQHNPDIPTGREALARLVREMSADVFYEPGLMIAEGAYVAIHGRIRGWAPAPQVVVDIFRIENGRIAEHWDVLQAEVATPAARSAFAMFAPDERAVQLSVNRALQA